MMVTDPYNACMNLLYMLEVLKLISSRTRTKSIKLLISQVQDYKGLFV
mgnify:CR=1 FL=1